MLQNDFVQLQCVVMDFEAAVWNTFWDMLPNVARKGCHFHWTQAIWRKVQDLGFAVLYTSEWFVQNSFRRLMCLPFLPHEHITLLFTNMILLDTPTSPMLPLLRQLLNYIQTNRTDSNIFSHAVRTNNDWEGWLRRLNAKIRRHHLPFYQLVQVLHRETQVADIQTQFMADYTLRRHLRCKPKSDQARILAA